MYGEEESWSFLVTEILVGFRLPWETITGCLTKADSFTYYGMLIPRYSYHHLQYKLVKLIFSSLEFEFFDPNIRFNCSLANLFWFPVFFFLLATAMTVETWTCAVTWLYWLRIGIVPCHSVASLMTVRWWRMLFFKLFVRESGSTIYRIWYALGATRWKLLI